MAKDLLSDRSCKTAIPGKHFDGGGLYLHVMPAGGRYWRLKYRHAGKEKTLALGVYPHVTLKQARDGREAAKKLIKAGIDPIAKRRDDEAAASMAWSAATTAAERERATLFAVVAESYFEKMHRSWSATHRRDVRRMIDSDLVPALGTLTMREIKRADIQAMLNTIVERGALTLAKDVRTYYRAIHRYFNATQDEELADPSARADLPSPPPERGHAALEPQAIGAFLRTLELPMPAPSSGSPCACCC